MSLLELPIELETLIARSLTIDKIDYIFSKSPGTLNQIYRDTLLDFYNLRDNWVRLQNSPGYQDLFYEESDWKKSLVLMDRITSNPLQLREGETWEMVDTFIDTTHRNNSSRRRDHTIRTNRKGIRALKPEEQIMWAAKEGPQLLVALLASGKDKLPNDHLVLALEGALYMGVDSVGTVQPSLSNAYWLAKYVGIDPTVPHHRDTLFSASIFPMESDRGAYSGPEQAYIYSFRTESNMRGDPHYAQLKIPPGFSFTETSNALLVSLSNMRYLLAAETLEDVEVRKIRTGNIEVPIKDSSIRHNGWNMLVSIISSLVAGLTEGDILKLLPRLDIYYRMTNETGVYDVQNQILYVFEPIAGDVRVNHVSSDYPLLRYLGHVSM